MTCLTCLFEIHFADVSNENTGAYGSALVADAMSDTMPEDGSCPGDAGELKKKEGEGWLETEEMSNTTKT